MRAQGETVKIFKVEAEGDTMYIQAEDKRAAQTRFTEKIGDIQVELLKWDEVDTLPDGEEFM
jgi:hypothetical protein